jgi:hypothetical protein
MIRRKERFVRKKYKRTGRKRELQEEAEMIRRKDQLLG